MNSKKIAGLIHILIIFLQPVIILAQSPLQRFKTFDIRNMSGEVLNLTSAELKRTSSALYDTLLKKEQSRIYALHNLMDTSQRTHFMRAYEYSLKQTRVFFTQNEPLFTIDPNLIDELTIEPMRRGATYTSSHYIENLIVPAIRTGFSDYTLEKVRLNADSLLQIDHKLDSLLNYSISYLAKTGIILNAQSTLAEINSHFERTLLLFDSKNLAINREVIVKLSKEAFDRLRGNIAIPILNSETQQIKAKLQANYTDFIVSVKIKTESSLNELGDYLNELSNNEVKIQKTINDIRSDWKSVQVKIKNFEAVLNSTTINEIDKLKAQAEHARLVAQNYVRLDVISKYYNYGVKAFDLIKSFKGGAYDKIFDADERSKFLDKLSSFDLPTLTETIQSAGQVTNLLARQFPNSKAIREVSKFINYAVAAINIGKGVAELFSGNPMGVLSMISGLQSLFGGAPQESPEMQMMKQMMDYMQRSFSAVFDHLEFIEKQLENLTVIVQDMYKDMIKSFQRISDQLGRIESRERILDERTRQILYGKLNNCFELENIRIDRLQTDSSFMSKYGDYRILYSNPECKPCLEALYTYTIRQNLKDFVAKSSTTQFDLSIVEIDTIYNPTRNLFKVLYAENLQAATQALSLPNKMISGSNKIFFQITRQTINNWLDTDSSLNTYYDFKMIENLAHLLITYSAFAELGDEGFRPKSILNYLSTDPAELATKRIGLRNKFTAVLELINSSLLQQSLISGNLLIEGTYQILLGYNQNNSNVDLAIQVLKSNRLFAKNFASRLIFSRLNSISIGDTSRYNKFSNLYYEAKFNEAKRAELNAEFGTSYMQFIYNKQFNNLFLELKVRGHQFEIPIPEPAFIISNEMMQSDAMYGLLKTKEKLVSKLIDLTFLLNYSGQNSISLNDLKYLYEPF